jgi:hypothetical protein
MRDMSELRAAYPRLHELMDGIPKTNPRRAYLGNFEDSIAENPVKRKHFAHIEEDLSGLDGIAWAYLRAEVANRFKFKDPLRGWQSAFDALNEARGYNYLMRMGYTDVAFLPPCGTETPDLQARMGNVLVLCEVKTINASKLEAAARQETTPRLSSIQSRLPDAFLTKFKKVFRKAQSQMAMFNNDDCVHRIAYIVLNFDDNLNEHVANYIEQVRDFALALQPSNTEIVFDIKPAWYSATTHSASAQLFVCAKDCTWRQA